MEIVGEHINDHVMPEQPYLPLKPMDMKAFLAGVRLIPVDKINRESILVNPGIGHT